MHENWQDIIRIRRAGKLRTGSTERWFTNICPAYFINKLPNWIKNAAAPNEPNTRLKRLLVSQALYHVWHLTGRLLNQQSDSTMWEEILIHKEEKKENRERTLTPFRLEVLPPIPRT
ncbi:hypothetical protein J6590_037679 [Homalodisca vitripennis]|nr:hypothetical protein J6590_037679 [Homalodisca vitripennis]